MTQKELAYVEDAIGHEAICQETKNYLKDEALKSFIESEISKHEETKGELMHMLEVKANE